jgi:hypothetical protein
MGADGKSFGNCVFPLRRNKMKKLLVLFVVLFTAIPVFAQDDDKANEWKSKRMAITLNPTTIILGTMNEGIGLNLGFEYAFLRTFSAKLNMYAVAFRPIGIYADAWYEDDDTLAVSFRFALDARWYPLGKAIDGLVVIGGFQYQQTLGNFYIDYPRTKFKGNTALGGYLGAGYKFILGKGRVSFVIEPTLDVIWSFHLGKKPEYTANWMLGQNGFRFGTNFGFAF